jgi:hypothetical protein
MGWNRYISLTETTCFHRLGKSANDGGPASEADDYSTSENISGDGDGAKIKNLNPQIGRIG